MSNYLKNQIAKKLEMLNGEKERMRKEGQEIVEKAQKAESEEQEKKHLKKMEINQDAKMRGKHLEDNKIKKNLETRIQKMKERDELRKAP